METASSALYSLEAPIDDIDYQEVVVTDSEDEGIGLPNQESALSASVREDVVAEPTDDFIRNYLARLNMTRTLEAFQTEWAAYVESGGGQSELLPEAYSEAQELRTRIKTMEAELERLREQTAHSQEIVEVLRRERDFHKIHHRRTVQEKNKLITDMRRLARHIEKYAPALDALHDKLEASERERTLLKIERDRLTARNTILENQLRQSQGQTQSPAVPAPTAPRAPTLGPVQGPALPRWVPPSQNASFKLESATGSWVPSGSFTPMQGTPVTGLDFHSSRPVLSIALESPNGDWTVVSAPSGDAVVSNNPDTPPATRHTAWIASAKFHPSGAALATCSADTTARIWDFAQRTSVPLIGHTGVVWDCSWAPSGQLLSTASGDATLRVWDSINGVSRQAFHGHTDAVNSIAWCPRGTGGLISGGADKVIQLWDVRSSNSCAVLYGHTNAVNSVAWVDPGSTTFASADADGFVFFWDVRQMREPILTTQVSTTPLSSIACCGPWLAAASEDGLFMMDVASTLGGTARVTSLGSQGTPVTAVAFDKAGTMLAAASEDGLVRCWSHS